MSILRTWICSLIFVCAASLSPAQQSAAVSIETVIRDQIADFEAGDIAGAFEHASPMIREMFQTPEVFGQMVRNGYPMVWRPEALAFGPNEAAGQRVFQRVTIRDAQGRTHFLQYEMIPAGETWKINGVRFLEPPEVGA